MSRRPASTSMAGSRPCAHNVTAIDRPEDLAHAPVRVDLSRHGVEQSGRAVVRAGGRALRPRRLESDGRRGGRRGRLAGLVAQAGAVPAHRPARARHRAPASRTPSCTATPTSASWTARATPRSWSSRPPAWGWTPSRSPTTTGCTAWSGSPRPPPSSGSAPSSARSCRWGSPRPQNGVADPEGSHLLLLARDPDGYRGLCRTISTAQLAGQEKGRPVYDLDGGRRRHGRARARAHRVPQGRGAAGAGPRGARGGGRRAPRPGRAVRAGQRRRRALLRGAAHGHRGQRRPGRARRRRRAAHGRQHRRPLRRAGAVPAGHGAGGGPGPAQPGRGRRLAAARGHRAPALGCGDGGPVRRPPSRSGGAGGGVRCGVRVRDRPGRPGPAPVRDPAGPHGGAVAARAHPPRRPGALRQLRRVPRGRRHRGAGAGGHRGQEVPRLLPDRARHRGVLPRVGHPLPGPRLGGELRGLLRAGDHERGRGGARAAVRAVPVPGPRRLPRHRPRHRVGPPRGGHPVRLQPLRARPGGPGGERDQLPAAVGGARRREGAGVLARASRTRGASRSSGGTVWRAGRSRACPSRSGSWRTSCSASPATSASTPAAWSSATARWRRWCRSSGPGWTAARSCSGTRTTARRPGW